ncbi:MAG: hypothetical protein C4555_05220 [Dehalococcoidia bacterium]|nr:MAG: hypothetical protein C4555_05220 [Dehalococcoidia bacterium]
MDELTGPIDLSRVRGAINTLVRRENQAGSVQVNSSDQLASLAAADLGSGPMGRVLVETLAWESGRPVKQYWRWQTSAPAWDITARAASGIGSGFWVQSFPQGYIPIEAAFARCDYDRATATAVSNDVAAVNWLFRASSEYRLPGKITRPTGFEVTTSADVIEIRDYTNVICEGDGALCFNVESGLPMFWEDARNNFNLDVEICFGGTVDRTRHPYNLNAAQFVLFYGSGGRYPRPGVSGGGIAAAPGVPALGGNGGLNCPILLLAGGKDWRTRVRFTSLTRTGASSDSNGFIRCGMTVTTDMAGGRPEGIEVEMAANDGVVMPMLAHAIHSGRLKGNIRRFGCLDILSNEPGTPANPSPHSFCYLTTDNDSLGVQQGCETLEIGPIVDKAENLAVLDGAHATIKFRGCKQVHVHDVISFNPYGVLQGAADYVNIHDISAHAIEYAKCTANSSLGYSAAPWHIQDVPSGTPLNTLSGHIHDVYMRIIDDVNGTNPVLRVDPSVNELDVHDLLIDLENWSSASPLFLLGSSGKDLRNVEWNMTLRSRTALTGSKTLLRLDATNAVNNKFHLHLVGFTGASALRCIENVKATSFENRVKLTFAENDDELLYFGGGMVEVTTTRKIKAAALSGASVTLTNALLAGRTVLDVTSQVNTAITGATGYLIGPTADPDGFGDITGTSTATKSNSSNYTANHLGWRSASSDIVLTAKTSNFTGGEIEVCIRERYTVNVGFNDFGGLP